jgi:type IV secretion system protein VirB4
LRRWLKSDGKYPDGDYAYIFDNKEDRLQLQHKMGFDLTHFMNHEPDHIRTALMMYLCHRIELSMNGQLVRLYFDEGWQNLMDPYWKTKFQRWLPTLRKKNAFIVITTQSPSTVIASPIRSMMLDNVATQLFFTNPQAKREDYIDGFKLTESEFEAIANNTPESRIFLVKQEHDSSLCRLNLGHLADALAVLSGNTATVLLLDQIREEVGDDPTVWLPIFHERRKDLRA